MDVKPKCRMSTGRRNRISESLKKFFLENPEQKAWGNKGNSGKIFSDKHRKKISEGLTKYCANNQEAFESRSKANKGKVPWNKGCHWPEDVKEKISESNKRYLKEHPEDRRHVKGPHRSYKHTPESLLKIRAGVKKAILEGRMGDALPRRFHSGQFYSKKNDAWMPHRSAYELFAYKLLEQMTMVARYENEPFAIEYFDGYNNVRNYIPDILVTYKTGDKELIEIRPRRYLSDIKTQRKFKAARKYCGKNGFDFSVWTEDQIFKHKIRNPVSGILN